jgi:hypothetical protein
MTMSRVASPHDVTAGSIGLDDDPPDAQIVRFRALAKLARELQSLAPMPTREQGARTMIRLAAALLVILACACDVPQDKGTQPGTKYETATDQLLAEFGGNVTVTTMNKLADLAKRVTLEARSLGITKMVGHLKATAPAAGYDATPVADIEDHTFGEPLPGVGELDQPKTEQSLAAGNPNVALMECPPYENTGAKSCAELVDEALALVKADVNAGALNDLVKQMFDQDPDLAAQPQDFKDFALAYLGQLALDLNKFGIDVAAVRAEYALRKAEKCDQRLISGKEIAKLRGIEEGEKILREMIKQKGLTLAPKGGECVKIGQTGAAADAAITAATEKFITEQPQMCPDTSSGNTIVQELGKLRRDGIKRAIKAHTTTIMVGIFRNGKPWKVDQYTVIDLDGCEAKDQIQYTTSPLVLDLDGDGLELTTDRVRFDLRATGQRQQVTWTGKNEGFLALDLNNDGRITSGRELFGNHSLCGSETCADGAVALAVHDSNHDGRIDPKDGVWKSLRIWVDRNHDGQSQPDELRTLAEHGIRSVSLQATPLDQLLPGGKVTLSLKVETDHGSRTAYDVWFDNLAAPNLLHTPAF